ncbi:ATP-binding protein [Streptomyces xiamenensis]
MEEQHRKESITGFARNSFSGKATTVIQAGTVLTTAVPGQAQAPPLRPQQIPVTVTDFIGRTEELAAFSGHIDPPGPQPAGHAPVLLVCGPAGVGKTALAVWWAWHRADRFPDGMLFADMHGYNAIAPLGTGQVLESLLHALGAGPDEVPPDLDNQIYLYRRLISGRRFLIVVDNAYSADSVRPLLAVPDCVTVITSRNTLPGLVARDGARRLTLGMLSEDDSVRLLARIAGPERIAADPAATARIARLCGGLPLALRVVAERIATHRYSPLEEIAAELADEEARLEALGSPGDEGASIQAVFSWSYAYLSPVEALAFRMVALIPGEDVSTGCFLTVCPLAPRVGRRALEALAGLHLLEQTGRHRFTLHDLLRAYARGRAESEDSMEDRDTALRTAIGWYEASAAAADRHLTPGFAVREPAGEKRHGARTFDSFAEALAWFEEERTNLVDIVRRAGEAGEYEAAANIAIFMWGYFNHRKNWSDWITCTETGIAAARQAADSLGEAWLQTSLGVAYRNLRRFPEARNCHREAVRLFEERGDREGCGFARQNLAVIATDEGELTEAMQQFFRALDDFRSSPEGLRGELVTLNSMAITLHGLGEYADAARRAQNALDLATRLDDPHAEAFALHNLGRERAALGHYEEAVGLYDRSLAIRGRIKDLHGQALALSSLGNVHRDAGHLPEALLRWQEALDILTGIHAPEAEELRAKLDQHRREA